MTLTHKIAKHTTIQAIGRVMGYLLSLISIIFVTRYLGTTGFGEYVTITVFVNAIAVFAEFGLDQILIKEFFRKKTRKEETIANAIGLRITLALSIFILGCLIGLVFPYARIIKIGIWIFAFSSFIATVELIFVDIFQIALKMHYQVVAEFAAKVLSLLLIILSIYFDLGLLYILLSIVAGSVLQFLMAYIWAEKFVKIKIRVNIKIWKAILAKAFPLAISSVFFFICYRIDTIILSVLKSSSDVGIYGASYKVLDIVLAFPSMFAGLLFPVLANTFTKNNIGKFNQLIQKGFNVLIITGIPITIILFGLAKPIILLIAGNQFISSVPVLMILSLAVFFIFANWVFWIAVVGGDRQKATIRPLFVVTIFNIVANLIFIPIYSYYAAAVITVITQLLILAVAWTLSKKFFKIKITYGNTIKAAISGAVMLVVFIIIQKWDIIINWHNLENINTFHRLIALALVTILGAAIYLGLLYALGGINKTIVKKVMQNEGD